MNYRTLSLFLVCLLCGVTVLLGEQIHEQQRQKLHPALWSIFDPSVSPRHELRIMRASKIILSSGDTAYTAIVHTTDVAAVRRLGIPVNSVHSKFVTVTATAAQLLQLATLQEVTAISPGAVRYPTLDVSVPETGATLLHAGYLDSTSYTGKGVIVLLFDTGIDWKHLDFRKSDTTKSRVLAIWDQTLTPTGTETNPSGFSYGVEYTQTQINNELGGSPAGVVREKDSIGHGTHVASIAAGNGLSYYSKYKGMAPEADIIVVKGGNGSFSTANIIDGFTYAAAKAAFYGEPIVVNLSLGGQSGPHDGTSPEEAAIDSFVTTAGHGVCVAAGNDGSHAIHTSGTISASGSASVTFTVPSYTPTSGSNNDAFDFDLWFSGNPTVTATVTSPNNKTYSLSSGSGQSQTSDGMIELVNEKSSLNNLRHIELAVYDQVASQYPASGTWTLTLSAASVASSYQGWLDENILSGVDTVKLTGGDVVSTVAMPGTAKGAITVGSYVTKWTWESMNGSNYTYSNTVDRTNNISSFSSLGPTRDSRVKPDVAAPGQGIGAALSSSLSITSLQTSVFSDLRHFLMQGTSMATPHATGAVALLLQAGSSNTAAQLKSMITATANTDSYTGAIPNATWGYGKLDVLKAMTGGAAVRHTLSYDSTSTYTYAVLTGSTKYAVKFSPSISGRLSGIQVKIAPLAVRPIEGNGPLKCEVYSSTGGLPGTKLGSTVSQAFTNLTSYTYNYIQMLDAGVSFTSGNDYFVVLSVTNATDTIILFPESATGTHSYVYNGSSWSLESSINHRIRAVITSGSTTSGLETEGDVPKSCQLYQNYPNPFNPLTRIMYQTTKQSNVCLKVYDLLGREIATLAQEDQSAGTHTAFFNGVHFASGVYFYKLQAGSFTAIKRMVLLK